MDLLDLKLCLIFLCWLIWRLFSKTACLSQTVPQILSSWKVYHSWDTYLFLTVFAQVDSSEFLFVPVVFENLYQDLFFEFRLVFASVVKQHV